MSEQLSPLAASTTPAGTTQAGTAQAGDAGAPPKAGESAKVTFSDEQQRELNRLIAAARREGKDSAKADAASELDALRNSLQGERDSARAERDRAHGQLSELLTALTPEIETAWSTLPVEITALYEGGETDVLAKRTFMAKHAELIEKLAGTADAEKQRLRTPRTPSPARGTKNGTFEPLSPVSI